jgi:glycosidase
MHGADLTPAQRWDAAGHGVDRDTARTPMQWSAAPHAAFTSGTPWLPVARDHRERNVAAQDADARSILAFYRQLLSLRRTSPALQHGTWTPLLDAPRDVLAYLRVAPEQRMLVLLNLSDAPTRVRFPAPLPVRHWTPRVSTSRPDIGWTLPLGREVLLRPYEATVFEAA